MLNDINLRANYANLANTLCYGDGGKTCLYSPPKRSEDDIQVYEGVISNEEALTTLIDNLISELTPREQYIVRQTYGLDDGKCYSLSKISRHIDVSATRTKSIQRESIWALMLRLDLALRAVEQNVAFTERFRIISEDDRTWTLPIARSVTNKLMRGKINTVGELIQSINSGEIRRIRLIGPTHIEEILQALRRTKFADSVSLPKH